MFDNIGRKDIFYVSVQVVLFGLYAFPLIDFDHLEIPDPLRYFGVSLAIVGVLVTGRAVMDLGLDLSPFPTPKAGAALHREGVFSLVRHPIYTGILFGGFGWALYSESSWRLVITGALYVLFYLKSVYEEKQLDALYEDYSEYRSSTGRFFPKL